MRAEYINKRSGEYISGIKNQKYVLPCARGARSREML